MKILGIGIDIVENSRIKRSLKKSSFLKKIFTPNEIKSANRYKDKTAYYSKRFAAKEAFVKSIGLGFRYDLNFIDISITNDKLGKPFFIISEKLKKIIKKKFKVKTFNFFLSISDEKKYSIAYVILQKNENR